jgi:phosphoribosylanthranilate isomerase
VPRTRIKIDGICRPQDAAVATRAGVDAVGIILDPTAGRHVSTQTAAKIVEAAGPLVTTLGVFVNASVDEIQKTFALIPLNVAQLHGDETPQFVADLKPIRVIKALHLAPGDTTTLHTWRQAIADLHLTNLIALVVESARPTLERGGTGIASDFAHLHDLQSRGQFKNLPPVIVAGGLTPQNVGDVVRLLRPYAVDVSSGVESTHREKSTEKLEDFVRAVREA